MAPILSKVAPPPPKTPQEAAALAYKKARPILDNFLEVLREVLEKGHCALSHTATQLSSLSDRLVTSTMRVLENYCCMDLSKFARGPEPKLQGSLPILFVLMLLMMLYNAFVLSYMPAAGIAFNSPTSLIFHAFIFLVFASFVQAVRTDPGTIPPGQEWRTKGVPPPDLKERKHNTNDARWCRKSEAYKPDRAHFCRVLRRPVLRMDHHCPWLGNTIGFANHKYFYLFLLYTTAACSLLGFSVLQLLVQATLPALTTFLLIGAEGLTLLLSSILLPFFLFHTWLLVRNMTTIEFCEQMRARKQDEEVKGSAYDMGLFENLRSVLGENPFLWWAPIGGPMGDGVRFPTRPSASASAPPEPQASSGAAASPLLASCAAEASGETLDPEAAHPHPAAGKWDRGEGQGDGEGEEMEDPEKLWPEDGDLEAGGWVEGEEYEGEEDYSVSGGSQTAASATGQGCTPQDCADFLTWHSAAEFVDDLRVGCEVIEETVETTAARLVECFKRPRKKAFRHHSAAHGGPHPGVVRVSGVAARRGSTVSESSCSGADFLSS